MYMIFFFMSVHLGACPPPIPRSWLRYCCQLSLTRSLGQTEDGRFRSPPPPPPHATRNRRHWVQGPLKGPGSSRVVLMLFRAIWALFLSILIRKIGFLKHSWSNFRGARLLRPPPPRIHHQLQQEWFTMQDTRFRCR